MHPAELIRKKRNSETLSKEEMKLFFGKYLDGAVADYQVSAMLMAIFLNGMDNQEAAALTEVMRDSGTVLKWNKPKNHIVDKHSTGGVGDKTSFIILPLAVCEGLTVPMIAGRGLGHTGGTLDKLESISGVDVRLSGESAKNIIDTLGGAFLGQSDDLAPLDRKLYAMRDVTSTVESIPLITASILSKKLSEGIGGLVMDVKYGTGAFMEKPEEAESLALSLKRVGEACGVKTHCLITDMNSPLGLTAGNALEIEECLSVMKGKYLDGRLAQLSVSLTAQMVHMRDSHASIQEIEERLFLHLESGRAFEMFEKVVSAQGGDMSIALPSAKFVLDVCAKESGYVQSIDTRELGMAIVEMGGGRKQMSDPIDHGVGLSALSQVGDRKEKGDLLCRVHLNLKDDSLLDKISEAYIVKDLPCAQHKLVLKEI